VTDEPESIGGEIRAELGRFGPDPGTGALAELWPSAVGEEIARNAWPARVRRDGTLVVHVRDSVWGFELTQRAAEIAARLPGRPSLSFVPGPLPDVAGEPSPAVPEAPRATLAQAEEAGGWVAAIADDELREAVARAARASLARAAADRPF
jgi:Dna[CI] antecedent, DciA